MSKKTKDFDSKCYHEGTCTAAVFAIVLIVIVLPVWWFTTTVYRASLPYSAIEDLSQSHVQQSVPLMLLSDHGMEFKKNLEKEIQNTGSLIKFALKSRTLTKGEKDIIDVETTIEEKILAFEKLISPSDLHVIVLQLIPSTSSKIFIGAKRLLFVSPDVDMTLLSKTLKSMSIDPLVEERLHSNSLQKQTPEDRNQLLLRQVPTEPGYDITITLMIPQPYLLKTQVDLNLEIETYLSPLLEQFKEIFDVRVRSQMLYMTSLKVSPKWSETHQHFALPQQQLPLTINAIEAKLGTFVSTRPSLHFIIYIPKMNYMPLRIHNAANEPIESNSFLVPRWGGVIITNPIRSKQNQTRPEHFDLDYKRIMQIIVTHLHKLLPIPQLDTNSLVTGSWKMNNFLLTDWQLDGLARARVIMYLNNIKITLQSLCDLVGEISNMVVSDEVAGWVWASVEDWKECLKSSNAGNVTSATEQCTSAFKYSDAAFFHPSMLALLYFPDNQKYAIYTPLFLPVTIHVIVSIKMIYSVIRKSQKKIKAE